MAQPPTITKLFQQRLAVLSKPTIDLAAFTEEYSLLTTQQSGSRTETHTYTATKSGTIVLVCVGIGANSLTVPAITTTGTMISDSRKLKDNNGGGVGVALAILNSGESITATAKFSSYGVIYMKFWVQ